MTTPAAATREFEINGIRVLHRERPGTTSAALHVGVGWADETFATRGVTHVIEHLAMSAVRRQKFEMNATVTPLRTAFWANGRPEQVTTFLNEVSAALADLPMDRLDREIGVLRAETAARAPSPFEIALKSRYGNRGLGLGYFAGLGDRSTDHDVVATHLARWFVRGNAVLSVVGPMPEDLRLELPAGSTPARSFPEIGRPGAVEGSVADPVLSFLLPDRPEALLLARATGMHLEETLRHERGVVYSLFPEMVRLPRTGRVLVVLGAQSAPDAVAGVAEELIAELRRRAEIGVTREEIAEDLEWLDADIAHPDWDLADVDSDVDRMLSDLPRMSVQDAREVVAAVDPAHIAALARDALATAMLIVPEGTATDYLEDGAGCAVTQAMTVSPLRRRLRSRAPKGVALGAADGVVQYRDEQGDVHQVRLDECVGVGREGPSRLLIGESGCFIWVDPRDFAGASAVVDAIDRAAPAEVVFELEGAVL